SMFKPEKPEDNKYFQQIIDKSFAQFKAVVQNGRGAKLSKPLDEIANGQIFLGPDALALGLVDQIGYLDDAYGYAVSSLKLKKPQVVRYHTPPSLLEALGSKSNVGSIGASTNGSGGVNVQLDPHTVQEMLTP